MKDQDKNLQEQLNEEEIGNLSEKEFIAMIVKMIQNLRKRMEAQTKKIKEMFDKEIEDLKNKQTEKNKKEGGRTGREKVGSKGQGDGLWFLQNIVKTLLLFCRRSQRRLLSRGICSLSDVLQDHSGKSTDGRL